MLIHAIYELAGFSIKIKINNKTIVTVNITILWANQSMATKHC